MSVVLQTDLKGIKLHSRGKVRDMYDLGRDLLMVSTDRISAFDYVLPQGIPDKGRVLTTLSLFWFKAFASLVPNHLVTARVQEYPETLKPHAAVLDGRSMLIKKAEMFPVECVVRGYLVGSGHKEYVETGEVCGIRLPAGLKMADRLPELIFTPATKAQSGHDENIPFSRMEQIVGARDAARLRELSLAVYSKGAALAREAGIIIADCKFEFGKIDGEITLCDEVLTPDSSRFWEASTWTPGKSPASFDKQFVRDYLESVKWDKKPPVPDLPGHIVDGTRRKYLEICERLTGTKLVN